MKINGILCVPSALCVTNIQSSNGYKFVIIISLLNLIGLKKSISGKKPPSARMFRIKSILIGFCIFLSVASYGQTNPVDT
ncbi:MAG: hypothetical protein ABIR18_02320, partial [Chitinophagaceae bacterium]